MASRKRRAGENHLEIMTTKKYDMFVRHPHNRPLARARIVQKKRALSRMGWIPGCPLLCVRQRGGKLIIYDGQSRFDAAKEMDIGVWYVVDPTAQDFTPADFNNADAQSSWSLQNYIDVYALSGNEHYRALKEYCVEYELPISFSARVLTKGLTGKLTHVIRNEEFEVERPKFAAEVGAFTRHLRVHASMSMRSNTALLALYNLMQLPRATFDPKRLIYKASKFPQQIKPASTVEQYLLMFEGLYNYHATPDNSVNVGFLANNEANRRKIIGRPAEGAAA